MRNHRSVLIREDHDLIYTLGRLLQLPLGRHILGEESRGRETTVQKKTVSTKDWAFKSADGTRRSESGCSRGGVLPIGACQAGQHGG